MGCDIFHLPQGLKRGQRKRTQNINYHTVTMELLIFFSVNFFVFQALMTSNTTQRQEVLKTPQGRAAIINENIVFYTAAQCKGTINTKTFKCKGKES